MLASKTPGKMQFYTKTSNESTTFGSKTWKTNGETHFLLSVRVPDGGGGPVVDPIYAAIYHTSSMRASKTPGKTQNYVKTSNQTTTFESKSLKTLCKTQFCLGRSGSGGCLSWCLQIQESTPVTTWAGSVHSYKEKYKENASFPEGRPDLEICSRDCPS